jgi:hypothetical protein
MMRIYITNVSPKLLPMGIDPTNNDDGNVLSEKIIEILPTCQQWTYITEDDALEIYIGIVISQRVLELGEVDTSEFTLG